MREKEKMQEQKQNSNVVIGKIVGTIDKTDEDRCLGKVKNVGGDQNVENEAADNTEESKVNIYDIKNKEQISEACSSDKDKEDQNIHEIETSRGEESIEDHKAEKDERVKEGIVEKDTARPVHLIQGLESKYVNDEEDEDIMREIEEQLKDISVARI